MQWEQAKQRFLEILSLSPEFKNIICSSLAPCEKRERIYAFLQQKREFQPEGKKANTSVDLKKRDAVRMLEAIFSYRSEKLAQWNLLNYLEILCGAKPAAEMNPPTEGFLQEWRHLLLALESKQNPQDPGDELEGREAALKRSKDLTQMAQRAFAFRYPYGLNSEERSRREENKKRILQHFQASEQNWLDWQWHIANTIKDRQSLQSIIELSPSEQTNIDQAVAHHIPFGITPYYASLLDPESTRLRDYALRAQVIPSKTFIESILSLRSEASGCLDFMRERDTSPIDGVTRRYPMIVIFKPFLTCPQICVYCQRKWQIQEVDSTEATLAGTKVEDALQWLEKEDCVREVLVTGGDPMMLSDYEIQTILTRLSQIPHIERIRIGTRVFVTLPQRFTDTLVESIARYHAPGQREILMVTHFEHSYEITEDALDAVQKFRRRGLDVYNQLVYTFYNSRKFEATFLRSKLRLMGVTPYYTFHTKGQEETIEFRVPIGRILQEQKEEARLFPGSVRTDEIVFNVPGLGKNYLRSLQQRDLITILPDGRRMYEFHPWENVSQSSSYLYTDVSIEDYLQRLESIGEKREDYESIWNYY